MFSRFLRLGLLLAVVVPVLLSCAGNSFHFEARFPDGIERLWLGPELWSNRLQDWRLKDGRIECTNGKEPFRTVHLLTHSLGDTVGDLEMTVRTGRVDSGSVADRSAWAGFLIGAGGPDLDYRARSLVHLGSGPGGGLIAALDGQGYLVFYDNTDGRKLIEGGVVSGHTFSRSDVPDVELRLNAFPDSEGYTLTLSAFDAIDGTFLQETSVTGIEASKVIGNIALTANLGADSTGASFWFDDWTVFGSKVEIHQDRIFGPVLSTMYTLSRGTMKLTAQLPPISKEDGTEARLETAEAGTEGWRQVATAKVVEPGWTATFRVAEWDSSRDVAYRVVYALSQGSGELVDHYYSGTIRKDPKDRDEIVVAAYTGNSQTHGTFGRNFNFSSNRIWFPHADIVEHTRSKNPDLLVFTGDQVYESRPTAPDRSGEFTSYLDYLYKWYLWCWSYRDLTRDIPTISLPDDHDVYHGNIWGAGGKAARPEPPDGKYPEHYEGLTSHWGQDGGGYLMPPEFVNMVQRTQDAHLPDPFDPAPIEQGITVYYTDLNWGGISFAILEDRKFKSSPSVAVPDAKVVNGFPQTPDFDMKNADVRGAQLLGERQEKFLDAWAADWRDAWMKVALSQTIFAGVTTYPKEFRTDAGTPRLEPLPPGVIPEDYAMSRDMDTNGWPQSGRNRALRALRKGFTFMIGGDQHLGSIVHHGVEEWDDAGFSFCVPSVANLWPRRWYPPEPGGEHQEGMPAYTGRYLDAFSNRITVWAVSNPVISGHEPATLHDRAPGYGLVRLNKANQTITMECWPRYAKPGDPESEQYPGWPLTITMAENYARRPVAYLPKLEFHGLSNPVVQVVDSGGEIVYTTRILGESYRPGVFADGTYTLHVGEPGTDQMKTLSDIHTVAEDDASSVSVEF